MSTNQFMQKKVLDSLVDSPYTLFIHYNTINSKEWRILKDSLHTIGSSHLSQPANYEEVAEVIGLCSPPTTELNVKIQFMVVPLRILLKVLGHSSFPMLPLEQPNKSFFLSPTGSSCLFFCKNLKQAQNILKIIQKKSVIPLESNNSLFLNSFITMGVFQRKNCAVLNQSAKASISFFNTYDLEELFSLPQNLIYTNCFNTLNKAPLAAIHLSFNQLNTIPLTFTKISFNLFIALIHLKEYKISFNSVDAAFPLV